MLELFPYQNVSLEQFIPKYLIGLEQKFLKKMFIKFEVDQALFLVKK
jgi:hypothetical protein